MNEQLQIPTAGFRVLSGTTSIPASPIVHQAFRSRILQRTGDPPALLGKRGFWGVLLLVLCGGLGECPRANAAARLWIGAGPNGLWSTAANWNPAGAPQNGDSLTFPIGNPFTVRSMVNDLANLTFDTLSFTGAGYTLDGNALTLIQGVTDNHAGALNRLRCDVQFTGGGGRFNSISAGQLEVSGTTTLANNQELIVTPLVTNITISGVIQGPGSLVKRGEGALFLRGGAANTYTGSTRVEGGPMHLAKTSAARAISSDVIVDATFLGSASLADDLPGQYPPVLSMIVTNGGAWFLTNGATVNRLFLADGDLHGGGLLNLAGDVVAQGGCRADCSFNLGSQTRTFSVEFFDSSGQLEVFGNILGPLGANVSGIIKDGSGLLILKNQNTYLGPTLVKDGYVHVQHGGALGATGPGGETRLQGGILVFEGGTFTCPEPIVVENPFGIEFSGNITLTGSLTLNSACAVGGLQNADTLEISGTIDGPGGQGDSFGPAGLQVSSGIVRLSGQQPNTYGGGTLISSRGVGSQGTLELAKPDGVLAVPGEVVLHASGAPPGTAVLRQLQNGGVTGVSIEREGSWLLNGHDVSPDVLRFRGAGFVDTQGGVLSLTNRGSNQLEVLSPNPVSYPSGYIAGISGRLQCAAPTNVFLVESNVTLNVSARVSGAAALVKKGPGTLRFSGSNDFTGPMIVDNGTLTAAHPSALGTAASGTLVNNAGSLALDGGFNGLEIAGETLTLNSTGPAALTTVGLPVTNTWNGSIVLQRNSGIHLPNPLSVLTCTGAGTLGSTVNISGPGGLTKSGPGTLVIAGLRDPNTYTGPTTITDGLLEATRAGRSISASIVVTGPGAILRTGRAGNLFNAVPTVLPAGASVTVENGGLWTMNPTNFETLGRLQGDGRLDIGPGGILTVSNSVSCTFAGVVSGPGTLHKRGLASLSVTGQSPAYTGPVTLFDGTYKVDGYFGNSPITVKVSSVLRGSGAAGDVTVENGGAVRMDPPGPGAQGGAMQWNSANFQAGGVLAAQFFGPHPTAGNDSLYVLNNVTLGNSAHSFGFSYPPHEGDVITLIQKIAPGAVAGAFSGFPESALRTISGIPVVMSYLGGNGNDVTLTVTNLPAQGGGPPSVAGSGGQALIPNDCSSLWLEITNRSGGPLTDLHGVLRSLTDGVLVTRADTQYPNLAPNAHGANTTPFQIRTEAGFPCGAGAQFELVLTGSNLPPMAIRYTLTGASGHALEFDGRNGEVDAPSNAFAGVANNFTIELWANPTGNRTVTAETNAGLSGVSLPLHQAQRFAIFPDRGNLAYGPTHVGAGLSIGRNGISAYEQGTNHLPSRLVYSNALSGWTHVALVYANRAPRLYVNGELVRSGSASLFPNVHPSASLGGSVQADYGNYSGQLDEVRIWNIARSQAQIQADLGRPLAGDEPGLLVYYRCDEESGDSLTDSAPANPNITGVLADGASFAFPGVVPFSAPGLDCRSGGGACESCLVVSGRFAPNTPASAQRLSFAGPTICSPPAACPGLDPITDLLPDLPPTRNITHVFTNTSASELCVTARVQYDCPTAPVGSMGIAAYVGPFDPARPCATYLGDSGFGPPFFPFSFRVPARTNFVLVVSAFVTNLACDSYSLEIFGAPCPPPTLHIAKDAAPGKVVLQWSSAYPDYRLQSANTVEGALPFNFADVPDGPALTHGRFTVTNSIAAPRQFNRLAK